MCRLLSSCTLADLTPIKYLCENEDVHKTVFACEYGAHVEAKKGRKSRDTVSLNAKNGSLLPTVFTKGSCKKMQEAQFYEANFSQIYLFGKSNSKITGFEVLV